MDTFITLKGNENPSSSSSSLNTTKKSSSSSCKYTGVRLRKWGKWVSEIRLPNSRERIWLGSYDTPEKAARAFDAAQFCLRGKSANFNFPNDPPDIPGGQSMSRSEIQAAAARFASLAAATQGPEEPERVESMISYSPTISEGTVQMDSEMTRADVSFHEQLSLSAALGSGNYVSEFGYFTGFDDYMTGEYHTISQPDNCGYNEEDTYDTSLYHDTCLWNF